MRIRHPEISPLAALPPLETVVRLGGEVGELLDMLDNRLGDIVRSRAQRVVLDLSAVPQMSSLALGVVLAMRRAVVAYGGEFRVAHVHPRVLGLFRRTGVDLLFPGVYAALAV